VAARVRHAKVGLQDQEPGDEASAALADVPVPRDLGGVVLGEHWQKIGWPGSRDGHSRQPDAARS